MLRKNILILKLILALIFLFIKSSSADINVSKRNNEYLYYINEYNTVLKNILINLSDEKYLNLNKINISSECKLKFSMLGNGLLNIENNTWAFSGK